MPVRDISRVRGMGVADMESTSTLVRIVFSASLCSTPKRCSSSTITSPRSLNWTSLESSRWVPITTSTEPSAIPSRVSLDSLAFWNRDSGLTRTGKPANRSVKVSVCWRASSVVGTRTATCLPSCTALNAARTATSVLPKPTSPEISRSMGTAASMSCFTSLMVVSWSGVSMNGKDSSSSRCHGVSAAKVWPREAIRAEYRRINSPAICLVALFALDLVEAQSEPPILDRLGASPPTYREIWSS